MRFATDPTGRWLILCCLLAVFAYTPAFNNGFIADDYVILHRTDILKANPFYLYQVPPENFRFVSYVIFGLLKTLAGYHAWPFYAFNIGLHLANIVLLFRLLQIVLNDDVTARLAVLLFAVFQAPQEAVMWLAAMNETTLFFFTLLVLLFWSRKQHAAAAVAYSFALFCKESAIIIPVLVLLLDLQMKRKPRWQRYAFLAIPSAGFAVIFVLTAAKNFMLTTGAYSIGSGATLVVGKTLHRLLWPWFYVFLIFTWANTRRVPSLSRVGWYLCGLIVTMLPYMFIAYQTTLQSRQLYLASAVLVTLWASLLRPLQGTALLSAALFAFVVFNVGYLWVRKDAQFEDRAAPTTQLINVLRQHSPQKTAITNFPYPYPEIATAATLAVPGWSGFVFVADYGVNCTHCLQLNWNSSNHRYDLTQRP